MEDRTIPRQTVRATLILSDARNIPCELQIDLDARLSDFMNEPGQFIAIRDSDGITRIINKAHIIEITEF